MSSVLKTQRSQRTQRRIKSKVQGPRETSGLNSLRVFCALLVFIDSSRGVIRFETQRSQRTQRRIKSKVQGPLIDFRTQFSAFSASSAFIVYWVSSVLKRRDRRGRREELSLRYKDRERLPDSILCVLCALCVYCLLGVIRFETQRSQRTQRRIKSKVQGPLIDFTENSVSCVLCVYCLLGVIRFENAETLRMQFSALFSVLCVSNFSPIILQGNCSQSFEYHPSTAIRGS